MDMKRLGLERYWHWLLGTGWYLQISDCHWGIFFSLWHPIRYQSDSSWHHPHASDFT